MTLGLLWTVQGLDCCRSLTAASSSRSVFSVGPAASEEYLHATRGGFIIPKSAGQVLASGIGLPEMFEHHQVEFEVHRRSRHLLQFHPGR